MVIMGHPPAPLNHQYPAPQPSYNKYDPIIHSVESEYDKVSLDG